MSLNVEKDFLSNVDYLNALVSKIKNVNLRKLDSNLVYEVTYAILYLDSIIPQITDADLVANVTDIKTALDLFLTKVPYDNIKIDKKDYLDLLAYRYKDLEKAGYVSYVHSYSYVNSSPTALYIKQIFPKFITSFALALVLISGIMFKLPIIILYNQPFDYLVNSMANTTLFKATELVSSIVGLLIMCSNFICIMLDLLYIELPTVRELLTDNKFISERAKMCIESSITNVNFKMVKKFDRIERNRSWMNSMLKTAATISVTDSKFNDFFNRLDALHRDIEISSKNSKDKKHLYYNYAKIELMHNEFLELMQDFASDKSLPNLDGLNNVMKELEENDTAVKNTN